MGILKRLASKIVDNNMQGAARRAHASGITVYKVDFPPGSEGFIDLILADGQWQMVSRHDTVRGGTSGSNTVTEVTFNRLEPVVAGDPADPSKRPIAKPEQRDAWGTMQADMLEMLRKWDDSDLEVVEYSNWASAADAITAMINQHGGWSLERNFYWTDGMMEQWDFTLRRVPR